MEAQAKEDQAKGGLAIHSRSVHSVHQEAFVSDDTGKVIVVGI